MSYYRFAVKLFLIFFLAGSVILLLFYLDPSLRKAILAYQFTIGAIIVNWLFALFLLFVFLRRGLPLVLLLKSLGILAINIPIGIFYSNMMIWILSYARVTLENSTPVDIKDIQLSGCQTEIINKLNANESQTVWIKIPHDCDITIEYKSANATRKEPIATGLSEGKGFKMTYYLK